MFRAGRASRAPELPRSEASYSRAGLPLSTILIEDRASGTQLIQYLIRDGVSRVTRYDPGTMYKVMRMHTVNSMVENGFVHLPTEAYWLAAYLHDLTTFPNGTGGRYLIGFRLGWTMAIPPAAGGVSA